MLIEIILVVLAVLIVGSIMLQQGKGSDLGSAFGGGSSDSLFGPLGPSNFFSKITWTLISIFFVLCLLLAYIAKQELTLNTASEPDTTEIIEDQEPSSE
tara:strand:+ start:216 stop:512 length:297 start_codon:yes stop_codon:yes gene_type:complete